MLDHVDARSAWTYTAQMSWRCLWTVRDEARNLPLRDFEHNRLWLQLVLIAHDLF